MQTGKIISLKPLLTSVIQVLAAKPQLIPWDRSRELIIKHPETIFSIFRAVFLLKAWFSPIIIKSVPNNLNHFNGRTGMSDNKLRTSKLTCYIEAMIAGGNFTEGERLPPLRKLAGQFHLTLSTARRSLQELCERGILEFRHGSGTYVKPRMKQHKQASNISVILFEKNFRSTYCSYAMLGFQSMAAEYGWQLHLYFHPYGRLKSDFDLSLHKDHDALVLLGCYDTYDLSFLPKQLPGVGLEMHTSLDGQFSTVTLDPFDAACLAANHFRSLGLQHVKIISADMPVHRIRAMLFRQEWGSDHEVIDARAFLKCRIVPGCGYLFVSGTDHEIYAQEYFRMEQRILAENPAVLSIDGKNLIAPDFQPANTIAIDWPSAGEAVAEECWRRLNLRGANARRIYLTPKLHLYRNDITP